MKMIEWLSTEINPPKSGREIIAKNPSKITSDESAVKQCCIMKFHLSFSEEQIVKQMLDYGHTLWSYTE
jgi:hypothetical protein